HFGGASPVKPAQSSDGEDFMLARARRGVIGDKRNLAVVIQKTDSSQPVVTHSLAELGHLKIAEEYTALRKRSVELHHERLILGTDGPQGNGCAIFHCPRRNVLHRVWPDCSLGKLAGGNILVV